VIILTTDPRANRRTLIDPIPTVLSQATAACPVFIASRWACAPQLHGKIGTVTRSQVVPPSDVLRMPLTLLEGPGRRMTWPARPLFRLRRWMLSHGEPQANLIRSMMGGSHKSNGSS
jgi:hypothetical protein